MSASDSYGKREGRDLRDLQDGRDFSEGTAARDSFNPANPVNPVSKTRHVFTAEDLRRVRTVARMLGIESVRFGAGDADRLRAWITPAPDYHWNVRNEVMDDLGPAFTDRDGRKWKGAAAAAAELNTFPYRIQLRKRWPELTPELVARLRTALPAEWFPEDE